MALILCFAVGTASANHQDRFFDSNGNGVVEPGVDAPLNSDGDNDTNYNDACPYDPRPSDPSATPGNPTGDNNPATCSAFEDKDGDRFTTAQDPCDDSADNAACDRDGDGEPNTMDDCPELATGHMLGIPTAQGLPLKSCAQQPEDSIRSYMGAWGTQGQIGNALVLGVPPATRGKRRNIKAPLPIDVTCTLACEVTATVTLRSGEIGGEGSAALPAGGGTLIVKFNAAAKAEFKRKDELRGTVAYSGVTPGLLLSEAAGPIHKLFVDEEDGTVLSAVSPPARESFAADDTVTSFYDLQPNDAIQAATKFGGIAQEVAELRGCPPAQLAPIIPFSLITGPQQEVTSLTYGSPKRCSVPEQLATYARYVYDEGVAGRSVRVSYAVRALARTRRVQVCHQFYGVNGAWVAHVQVNPTLKSGEGCL